MRVIISGGGTGGHIFPAIAIANELKRLRPDIELLFVGAEGKIEMEKVPKAGYKIEGLWISGFHRKLTLRNLLFPVKLISSLWKSRSIVKQFKPDVVVGVGGFASGPTLKMAANLGIPTLIQEQNSYAGVTNKLLAKNANTICVAYDKMERYFPKEKIVMTGNPVRQDVTVDSQKRMTAFDHFGFKPDRKTIVLIGGSLGARDLNKAMAANTDLLKSNDQVQVLWQTGKLYIEEYGKSETAKLDNVKASAFIDRMDLAYSMADIVICRAGAGTISELCLLAKAVILVPSPNVAEDHQTKNAMALVEKGAAVLVENEDAKATMLQRAIKLLNQEEVRKDLIVNIKKLAKPNAANAIANEVLKLKS